MSTIFQTGQRAHRVYHAFVEIQKLLAELGIAPEVSTHLASYECIDVDQSIKNQEREIEISLHVAIPHVTNLVGGEHDSEGYVCLTVVIGGTQFTSFHYTRGFHIDTQDKWGEAWLRSKGLYRRKNLRQEEVVTFIRDFVTRT